MKYLKNFNDKKESKVNEKLVNKTIHRVTVKNLGEVALPDPEHGDLKLSVMPFENTGEWISLPEGFKLWEESLNKVMSKVPLQEGANTHFVTIDSKFFTTDNFLRREGIHVDGNFCVDPKFSFGTDMIKEGWGGASPAPKTGWGGTEPATEPTKTGWGGTSPEPAKTGWGGTEPEKTGWGGTSPGSVFDLYEAKEDNSHVKMDWILPYKFTIPFGDYISEKKGGILTTSSEVGCQAWQGQFNGEILSEGAYDKMLEQLTDDKKIVFEKNELYFMTSNTPHETLMIGKGNRRTFMRITLHHEYINEQIK